MTPAYLAVEGFEQQLGEELARAGVVTSVHNCDG